MQSLEQIIKELNVDRTIDYSSKLRDVNRKVSKLDFDVNGVKYVVDFVKDELSKNVSIVDISFKNITAIEKLKNKKQNSYEKTQQDLQNAKFGLTKTGNAILVFNQILNIVVYYLEKYKPTYVKFEAVEDNRKTLYQKLMARVEKQSSMKFKKTNVDPETGFVYGKDSQRFIYQVIY